MTTTASSDSLSDVPTLEEIEASVAKHRDLLPIATGRRATVYMLRAAAKRPAATIAALVPAVIWAISTASIPRLIGQIVDVVTSGQGVDGVLWMAGAIGAVGIIGGITGALCWGQIAVLGQTILAQMREDVIDRALNLPNGTMEKAGIGDALSRVADDVDVASRTINQVVPNLITTVLTVIFVFAGIASVDWRMLIAGLLVLPIYVWALRWYLPRSSRLYRQERVALGNRAQALLSSIQGAPTVHAYAIEDRQVGRVSHFSRIAYGLSLQLSELVAKVTAFFNKAEMLGIVLVLIAGYFLVGWKEISVGQATAGGLYFVSLFWPLAFLIFMADSLQSAGASLTRMIGVIDTIPPTDRARTQAYKTPRDSSITVRGVSHAYLTDADGVERTVLQPLDLSIAPGQTVAFVGTSGAGKSTLAAIISGTLRPTHGEVLWGGVPLGEMDIAVQRSYGSIISQDTHVFKGTLAEDLRLVNPEASDEDLWRALRTVQADGWVAALPDSINTLVGEKGHRLTPEQAQHLALARIVLQDPRILVMDEATADEGSFGARVLEQGALAASAGRTTLIVAHRLSQAARADRICVMENGRLIEQGTHRELLDLNGQYATLWSAWSTETH
ncbi:ABC transporter ATP-binding protein [Devriesea agamarum]|uniref:ABC transporter ATP-binding protein n=1 Tax=Devriesea agamarum TaxID=472569 RepID=UPI00071D1794|nr:ABC transporter ATP-binding protein [Devriesea agamarum]